ncbi:MAG: hypothetical protein GAK43_01116 [Stenotrophomonas maltophilia]|nr:MAG: hypothetical protein GAK43_01116 [Stenotrophomonas maltophilia]
MPSEAPRALVLCRHAGCLMNYGRLLNRLGFFRLSLCARAEVLQRLEPERRYGLFLLDELALTDDNLRCLEQLAQQQVYTHLLVTGDYAPEQRQALLDWAWRAHIPLLAVMAKPFSFMHLRDALDSLVAFEKA